MAHPERHRLRTLALLPSLGITVMLLGACSGTAATPTPAPAASATTAAASATAPAASATSAATSATSAAASPTSVAASATAPAASATAAAASATAAAASAGQSPAASTSSSGAGSSLPAASLPAACATSPSASAGTGSSSSAGPAPSSTADLAAYQGADREGILEAGAKAEGQLVWYTELSGPVVDAMVSAFEAKYPGITVAATSTDGASIAQKLTSERQAQQYTVDDLEVGTDTLLVLVPLGAMMPYWAPSLGDYPDASKQAAPNAAGLVLSTVDRESFIGFGYNTNLLPANDVPKTYEDLLNPDLKGKLAWSGSGSTGAQVMGTMIAAEGADFPTKLAAQDYKIQQVNGKALLDLIASGEVVASPTIYRNHVLVAQGNGAPVAWQPLDPVITSAGASGVVENAPHPHAALLWNDFILGCDGQAVISQFQYGNPTVDYGFQVVFPGTGMTADQYNASIQQWDQIMRSNAH